MMLIRVGALIKLDKVQTQTKNVQSILGFVCLAANFETIYYMPKSNIGSLSYDLRKVPYSSHATILTHLANQVDILWTMVFGF